MYEEEIEMILSYNGSSYNFSTTLYDNEHHQYEEAASLTVVKTQAFQNYNFPLGGLTIYMAISSDKVVQPLWSKGWSCWLGCLWSWPDCIPASGWSAQEGSSWWPMCLGPCRSLAITKWSPWLLVLAWPSPDCCSHFWSKPADERALSFRLLLVFK